VPSPYDEQYNDTAWWDEQYNEHYNEQYNDTALRAGSLPIYEPGVQEWFLDGGLRRQRLRFSSDLSGALKGAEALFISVESARGGEWAGRSLR
jgi:hypothetical protein